MTNRKLWIDENSSAGLYVLKMLGAGLGSIVRSLTQLWDTRAGSDLGHENKTVEGKWVRTKYERNLGQIAGMVLNEELKPYIFPSSSDSI